MIVRAKQRDIPLCLFPLTMLTTTHIAVTILLCMILNLNGDEWFVAMVFGVVIDIDHVFGASRYVSHNGWGALLYRSWDDGTGLPWKSLLHRPVGAFVIAPLSVSWRYFLPGLFWSIHLGMDYVQIATLSLSTAIEATLMASCCIGIVLIAFRNWSEANPDGDFRAFVQTMRQQLAGYGSAIRRRLGSIE